MVYYAFSDVATKRTSDYGIRFRIRRTLKTMDRQPKINVSTPAKSG